MHVSEIEFMNACTFDIAGPQFTCLQPWKNTSQPYACV